MRVFITITDAQASSEAAAVLKRAQPHWDVRVCRDSSLETVLGNAEPTDICVWDVGIAGPGNKVTHNGGPVVIAWCTPEDVPHLPEFLNAGASFHVVRTPQWQDVFVAVLTRAAQGLEGPAPKAREQRRSLLGRRRRQPQPPDEQPKSATSAVEQATDDGAWATLTNVDDIAELLRSALAAPGNATTFDAGIVVADNIESGDKNYVSHGLPEPFADKVAARLRQELTEEGRLGNVRPVLLTEVDRLSGTPAKLALRALYQEEGVARICRVPLYLGESVSGALVLTSRDKAPSGPVDDGLSVQFGLQLALFVSRGLVGEVAARVLETRERLLDVAVALSAGTEIDDLLELVADVALQVTRGRTCAIRILDDDRQQFRKTYVSPAGDPSPEHRAEWEAIDSGRPISAEADAVAATEAVVAVPMNLDANPIGVVSVIGKPGRSFSASEITSLRLLSAQAAVAVHNSNLYEIARRRSQHMEVVAAQAWQEEARARALFEIATAVTEKIDLNDILAHVTRSACTEIGFERARIYLADHEHQMLIGQLEATASSDPVPIKDERVPLRPDTDNPLAEAALGSAPYMIVSVQDESEDGPKAYERLFAPLIGQGMLVGLIAADNPFSCTPVSPQRTRLLHSLAGLASVAIERARVDKLRDTLISSVSHELRAPLASIRAYNELVMGGDAGEINEEQHLFLSRVERASARLERLISDLMNLSKLRSGEVSIRKEPTDLSTLIRGVLDTMQPKAGAAEIRLDFSEKDHIPPTMTDQGRLEQVVTNLVDNAIKFNNPGGNVVVTLEAQDNLAVISVADDGPGIPKSSQSTIFEEFQHGTDDRTRAKEGAGLGLAIARRVVEVLGGDLWVESEIGEGTTFYVSLHLESVEDQAQ